MFAMATEPASVVARLREMREQGYVRYTEIARRIGMSEGRLNNVMRGRSSLNPLEASAISEELDRVVRGQTTRADATEVLVLLAERLGRLEAAVGRIEQKLDH